MARDRQRAKQRQAERRPAAWRPGRRAPGADDSPRSPARATRSTDDSAGVDPSPAIDPTSPSGAPPEDEGRSDTVLDDELGRGRRASCDEDEHLDEDEDQESRTRSRTRTSGYAGAGEAGYEARGRRGRDDAAAHKDRPRVVQFLIAVWAELQRVQWPNRQALITLTGVVLGFVLIAGGYLGLLDAIFSELIKAIL